MLLNIGRDNDGEHLFRAARDAILVSRVHRQVAPGTVVRRVRLTDVVTWFDYLHAQGQRSEPVRAAYPRCDGHRLTGSGLLRAVRQIDDCNGGTSALIGRAGARKSEAKVASKDHCHHELASAHMHKKSW